MLNELGAREGAINMGQGFPDFEGSAVARKAAAQALDTPSLNQYSPIDGLASLRDEVSAFYERRYGARYDAASEVVVTSSGQEALVASLRACFTRTGRAGVVVMEPFYPFLAPAVAAAGGALQPLRLAPPTFAADGRALTPRDETTGRRRQLAAQSDGQMRDRGRARGRRGLPLLGLDVCPADGGYFLVADAKRPAMDFARSLADETGVVCTPLSVFYESPPAEDSYRVPRRRRGGPVLRRDDATRGVDAAAFWDLDAFPSVGGDAVLDAADPFCDAEDAAPDCVDGDAFWAIEAEPDYGAVDSHTIVDRDAATGAPLRTAFSFVDERACVGCNACASISPSTFFMEDEHGMARVFRQHGDADEVIEEAVGACPVNCIKTVTYDALERLEVQRRDQVINAAGRNSLRAEGMAPRTIIPASALVDTADPAFVEEELRRETERQRKARRALGTAKDRIVEL
ncbi:transferase [Aureococcus anophagefferens]|nr:transferase [Aureococcus anophagefferens]